MGKASRKKRHRTHRPRVAMERSSGAMVPAGRPGPKAALGLPPVGTYYTNAQGLEFQVLEHTVIHDDRKPLEPSPLPGHSLERLVTKRMPIEAPVVAVGGLSEPLARLLLEFNAVCPKPVVFVDTSQAGLAQRMRFGGHSINWEANPYGAIITLDSPETNEDVIAHELMHGWLGMVEGYEDRRMYRDRTDHAAVFLVDSTQCMVLDCMVQEAIGARGFDPCFWTAEIVDCLYEDGVALRHDIYPVTAYEASFAAKLYAWPEAVPHLFRFSSALAEKYIMARNMIREKMPDLARLGDQIAQAFREGSYRTNEDAHRLTDRCLSLMADYVGMDLDIGRDLEIWQPPEPKWVDKFPSMFPGWPVELKYEIHRRLIRDGWPTGTLIQASVTDTDCVRVTFHPSVSSPRALGASTWEWQSPRPLALPSPPSDSFNHVLERSSPAARMRPRSWELLNMGNAQTTPGGARGPIGPKLPVIPGAPQPFEPPKPQFLTPPRRPDRPHVVRPNTPERPPSRLSPADDAARPRRGGPTMRHYLPGLGRFISRVHLHQAVAMGRATYEELRGRWGVNIGPLGTPEAFAQDGVPEHPYAYTQNDPMNMVDPSGMWGTAIHRGKTTEWAKSLGFCDQPSTAIADGDVLTDSANWPGYRRAYHFRLITGDFRRTIAAEHLDKAKAAAKRGDCKAVWENLGHGLHALQDISAHGDYLWQRPGWNWLDDPNYDIHGKPDPGQSRLQQAFRETKAYLKSALADPNIKCCVEKAKCGKP